ncbi:MAG TPA: PAS domain-containing protein [Flavobacteriales bacterium]
MSTPATESSGAPSWITAGMDEGPLLLWTSGSDHHRGWCNGVWQRFTGMRGADAGDWATGIHPQDAERTTRIRAEAQAKCEPYCVEYRLQHHDGTYRWMLETATPILRDGVFQGYTGACLDITERKAAEDRLRLATEVGQLGVWDWDILSDRITWTDAVYRIHGVTKEEFDCSLSAYGELIHPDDRAAVRGRIQAALERDEPYEVEFRVLPPQGEVRWVYTSAVVLREEGRPVRMVGSTMDTTRRKAIEFALEHTRTDLQARQEQFTRFMAHLPGHAWIKDAQGRYRYMNQAVCDLVGRTIEELAGLTDEDIFPPDVAAHHRETDAQARAWGKLESVDAMDHADGTHHSLVSKFLIPDPHGGAAFLGGLSVDITEQRRVTGELHRAEERFQLLADNMAQLAWMHDPLTGATWYNRRFLEYTGLSNEEAVSKVPTMVHPDHVERVMAKREAAYLSGEAWEESFPLRGHDGAYRWFLLRSIPDRDSSGRVVRWFGTNTDITDQKIAQDRLLDADRRKDEFLATLAHELRNPLAPLRSGLELLSIPDQDTPTLDQVRRMMDRQLHQMVRLVDDLMDLSRISRGTIELRRQGVALDQVLQMAVETSQPLVQQHGHRFVVEAPPPGLCILGDPLRLAQVFSNLINNACKYTPSGGLITLRTRSSARSVQVEVEDTGIGIHADDLRKVFDMFTQVDRQRSGPHGGLGIGLNIAQRLVHMHGGHLSAVSRGSGQGSCFTVELPLHRMDRTPAHTPTSTPGDRAPLRILVVDDNTDAAFMLSLLLKKMGYTVRTANNGRQALRMAAEEPPELVLMDLGMPEMDGYTCCQRMRQDPLTAGSHIVALTGWGQPEDKRRTKEAGFDDHLVKPLEREVLVQMIEAFRTQRSVRTA